MGVTVVTVAVATEVAMAETQAAMVETQVVTGVTLEAMAVPVVDEVVMEAEPQATVVHQEEVPLEVVQGQDLGMMKGPSSLAILALTLMKFKSATYSGTIDLHRQE